LDTHTHTPERASLCDTPSCAAPSRAMLRFLAHPSASSTAVCVCVCVFVCVYVYTCVCLCVCVTLAAVVVSSGACSPEPTRPPSESSREGLANTSRVSGGDSTSYITYIYTHTHTVTYARSLSLSLSLTHTHTHTKCRFMLVDTRHVCECEGAGLPVPNSEKSAP